MHVGMHIQVIIGECQINTKENKATTGTYRHVCDGKARIATELLDVPSVLHRALERYCVALKLACKSTGCKLREHAVYLFGCAILTHGVQNHVLASYAKRELASVFHLCVSSKYTILTIGK